MILKKTNTSNFSSSQDWDPSIYKKGEQYPGYVIDKDRKKTEGFIKYTNRYDLQSVVYLYAEKDSKKQKQDSSQKI